MALYRCRLVIVVVIVDAETRLTDSGLSVVEWRPISGTLPPLSDAEWIAEFNKYKTSSEYQLVNNGMPLDEFKLIYWWEWRHRLLGRVMGAAFLLPLLFFLFRYPQSEIPCSSPFAVDKIPDMRREIPCSIT